MSAKLAFGRYPSLLAAVVTAGGLTPKVILYTNEHTYSHNTLIADLTQPTGDWYPEGGIAAEFGEPYWDPTEQVWKLPVTSVQFNWAAAGGATTETIRGWAVVDTAGPEVIFGDNLPAEKSMGTIYDSLIVRPEVPLRLNA